MESSSVPRLSALYPQVSATPWGASERGEIIERALRHDNAAETRDWAWLAVEKKSSFCAETLVMRAPLFVGLCFKLPLPSQNTWNIYYHELGTERAIRLIQVCNLWWMSDKYLLSGVPLLCQPFQMCICWR